MQTQEKIIEESRSFLATTEKVLSELLVQWPCNPTEDAKAVLALLQGAERLTHVYRTYPVFDPACLRMMREDIKARLFVPVFAFADLGKGGHINTLQQVWSPTSMDGAIFYAGPHGEPNVTVFYPEEQIRRNLQSFATSVRAPSGFTWTRPARAGQTPEPGDYHRLTAVAPNIPESVRRRIDAVRPWFDAMMLIWEAEWKADPVKDPFVIGVLNGKCFLVDQYDATKMERYVVSEMCQKPKE